MTAAAATSTVQADEADRIRRHLTECGVPAIVDVHTHFMPAPVMNKVWAYFDSVGPLTGRPWPITYRHSETERIETLRAFGVRAFTSLTYPHKPEMASWLNQWCTDFADTHHDCLRSATFYPEPGVADYVRAAIDNGVAVFKSHLQVGDYDPLDPKLDGVWTVLEQSGTPVVIHAGHGPAPGRFTGPAGIRAVLQRFPQLTLIIAHMGLPDYAQFLDLAAEYERVYLDTTMVFTMFTEVNHPFPPALRPRLVELGERILFGSDYPNIPYPYLEAVTAVTGLGLGQPWVRAVLHDNASRLFGLSPRPTPVQQETHRARI